MGRPYNDPVREWRREWIEYNLDQKLQREQDRELAASNEKRRKEREELIKNRKPWSKKSKSEKAWDIGCFGLIAIAFLSVCVGAIVRAIGE